MVQCNPSFPKKLIVLFASNGYTQVLYDLEERQTILMAETTTKNVPCLFLPSTCQGTGPVTACDCMESNESAAYLITQGMGDIMRWNKTAFIHFDFHFEANGCSPLLMLIPFNGVHSVLVKDHVDLQTVVRKERGTEDVEIFFGELIKGICYRIFFHL